MDDDFFYDCVYDDCDENSDSEVSGSEESESEESDEFDDEDSETVENMMENLTTIDEEDEEKELVEDEEKPEKKTKNKYFGFKFLTKFEKTRVLGVRTKQIIAGGKIFVDTTETDPYKIALEELYQKRMPLLIRRYFNSKYKDVSVNKLNILY